MIKTLLTAILLSILSVTAMAEHENTPTPAPEQEQNPSAFMKLPILTDCGSMDAVMGTITKYKEQPLANMIVFVPIPDGRELQQPGVMALNPVSKTWSIIALFPETNSACIVVTGLELNPANGFKPSKHVKIVE